jgi:hypothetical protein
VGGESRREGSGEFLLAAKLALYEGSVQGALGGFDGREVGLFGEQVHRMHRDNDGGVGVFGGDGFRGGAAHGEVVGKVNFLEGGVGPDEFPGESGGAVLAG